MQRKLAILSLIAVAFSYVLLSVAIRLMDKGFEPMTQVWLRLLLGVLLSAILFTKDIRVSAIKKTPPRDWTLLLIMGTVSYSVATFFITKGALLTSLTNVTVIYSTVGFFTYLYALLLLKEKFKPLALLLVAISFYGVLCVSTKSFLPSLTAFGQGELFMILAAAFSSFYFVGRKLLSKTLNNVEITFITMAIGFASGMVIALFIGEHFDIASLFNMWVFIGLILGGVLNIVATLLGNYAFEHIDIVLGNQILLVETLFSLVIGYLFYREILSFPEVIGAAIVMISVYVSNKVL